MVTNKAAESSTAFLVQKGPIMNIYYEKNTKSNKRIRNQSKKYGLTYKFSKWLFIQKWRFNNRKWHECRHKRRALERALTKNGFINFC